MSPASRLHWLEFLPKFPVMIILLIFYNLLLHYGVLAGPLPPTLETLSPRKIETNFTDRTRGDIIWSSFTTLFAVSWVAIHPNIPPKSEGFIRGFLRRLMLMIYMLLVPEAVILWAGRQWYAAGMIAKEHKGWTRTHGYFTLMGGFMLCDENGEDIEILQMYRLQDLAAEKRIVWPTITKDQIEDRSKGDAFSKAFALIQTTWFIIQIIARGVTGLVITELELATLAFAFLNGILYFLWWDKPIDVACPVPVHLMPSKSEFGMQSTDSEHGELPDRKLSLILSDSPTPNLALQPFKYEDDEFSDEGDLSATKLEANNLQLAQNPPIALHQPSALVRFAGDAMDTVLLPFRMFWSPVKLMAAQYHIPPSDRPPLSVPMFYAPCPVNFLQPSAIAMAVGIIFGGIHCIAWRFEFISVEERWLWRSSALTITGVPLLAATVLSIVTNPFMGRFRLIFELIMGGWIETLCVAAYFIARLFLLILPLIALRRLPAKALLDVDWSSYLPHI